MFHWWGNESGWWGISPLLCMLNNVLLDVVDYWVTLNVVGAVGQSLTSIKLLDAVGCCWMVLELFWPLYPT